MTINCKGALIDLSTPRVMGILNITPDSFYDGGKYHGRDGVLRQAEAMLQQGATFIDVGGYSSRPNAEELLPEEERDRVLPVVTWLLGAFPEIILSVDTFRSEVARPCLEQGAAMINDISGGELDASMMPLIAQFKVPYCMMHMKGTPQNMKHLSDYEDLIGEICYYFSEKTAQARALGINDLLIDPGFGFAKNIRQNFELLDNLDLMQHLDLPLLVGISRKSMIYKTLKTDAAHALNGTSALHMVALMKGAHILRAHDVQEAMECITLFQRMRGQKD